MEAVWVFFTPHRNGNINCRVKTIAIGAIYAEPNSQHKQATIDHIIETMHFIRSTQDNVHFLFGGNLKRLQLGDILEAICFSTNKEKCYLRDHLDRFALLLSPPYHTTPLQVVSSGWIFWYELHQLHQLHQLQWTPPKHHLESSTPMDSNWLQWAPMVSTSDPVRYYLYLISNSYWLQRTTNI